MNAISRTGNIFEDVAIKAPVRVATTAEIVLSGLQTIDDAVLIEGDRVLVKDQPDETQNGIYGASSGNWQRTVDASKNTDFVQGTLVPVATGTDNGGVIYAQQCADSPVVIGTSLITFVDQTDITGQQMAATSTTSLAIGMGAMTFATQAGKRFAADQWVLAFSAANPNNAVLAQITSYAGTALVVDSIATGGAGTVDDWQIVLANSPASAGRVPPVGTGNVSGPGVAVSGNLAAFDGPTGKVVKDTGIPAGTLAGRNQLLAGDAGPASIAGSNLAPGAVGVPYIAPQLADNLILSNSSTSPNTTINISPGRVVSDDGSAFLVLAGSLSKRLDQAWTAGGTTGAPAGGADSGVLGASQTWHFYLIGRIGIAATSWSRTSNVVTVLAPSHGLGVGGTVRLRNFGGGLDGENVISGVPDANHLSFANNGADVGATAVTALCDGFDVLASNQALNAYPTPAMPSGWVVKQCLGSVLSDGSGNVIQFMQTGDRFVFSPSVSDVNLTDPGLAATTLALTLPTGVRVMGEISIGLLSAGGTETHALVTSLEGSAEAVGSGNGDLGATATTAQTTKFVRTNTQAQVQALVSFSNANVHLLLRTRGWVDPRRRLF